MREKETPRLRWFDEYARCRCGKRSEGVLRGLGNESYGPHCKRCADARLSASKKEREKNDREAR